MQNESVPVFRVGEKIVASLSGIRSCLEKTITRDIQQVLTMFDPDTTVVYKSVEAVAQKYMSCTGVTKEVSEGLLNEMKLFTIETVVDLDKKVVTNRNDNLLKITVDGKEQSGTEDVKSLIVRHSSWTKVVGVYEREENKKMGENSEKTDKLVVALQLVKDYKDKREDFLKACVKLVKGVVFYRIRILLNKRDTKSKKIIMKRAAINQATESTGEKNIFLTHIPGVQQVMLEKSQLLQRIKSQCSKKQDTTFMEVSHIMKTEIASIMRDFQVSLSDCSKAETVADEYHYLFQERNEKTKTNSQDKSSDDPKDKGNNEPKKNTEKNGTAKKKRNKPSKNVVNNSTTKNKKRKGNQQGSDEQGQQLVVIEHGTVTKRSAEPSDELLRVEQISDEYNGNEILQCYPENDEQLGSRQQVFRADSVDYLFDSGYNHYTNDNRNSFSGNILSGNDDIDIFELSSFGL